APGSGVEVARSPEGAGRGQAKAASVVGQADDLAGVPREGRTHFAGQQVPEADRPIRAPEGEFSAIGSDGQAVEGRGRGESAVGRRGDCAAGRRVPDMDLGVDTDRDDVPAVGTESDAHHGGAMPFVAPDLPAGGRFPDPYAPVRADEATPRDDSC